MVEVEVGTDIPEQSLRIFADLTSIKITCAWLKWPKEFEKDYKRRRNRLCGRFISRIGRGLTGVDAANVLAGYLVEIESVLEELLSAHTVYYWLHLSRRVAPQPIGGQSPETAFLYRRILHMAICKFAQPSSSELVGKEFEIVDGRSQLHEVGYFESVAVYAAEYLAYEYWHATSCYRVVCKGGTLRQDGSNYLFEMPDYLDRLIRIKDARTRKSSLFGVVGSVTAESDHKKATLLLPYLNVGWKFYPLEYFFSLPIRDHEGRAGNFKPNFMPVPFDLKVMIEALQPFEEQVIETTGVSPSEFAVALEALWWCIALRLAKVPEYAYEFIQRGWYIYQDSVEQLCCDIVKIFAAAQRTPISHNQLRSILHKILDRFILTPERQSTIDLWTRQPSFLAIPVGVGLLIDLSAIVYLAFEVAYDAGSQDGIPGEIKGKVFEQQVKRMLESVGVDFWLCGQKLSAQNGEQREVDVSFVCNGQLYIVECKAFAYTYRLDKGDYWPINTRWEQLVTAHNQAEKLIDFLKRNPNGSNYRLPEGLEGFVPVVCTPHSEWVASSHEVYWLTDEIPVFCTSLELIEYIQAKGQSANR